MKPKTGLLILFLLLAGTTVVALMAMRIKLSPDDQRAARIIDSYIIEKGIPARPGTRAYSQFMKGILLGEYPELTDASLGYLDYPADENFIINYAARYIARQTGSPEYEQIPEAPMP